MPAIEKNRMNLASMAAAATFALLLAFTLKAKSQLSQELASSRESTHKMRVGNEKMLQSNTALNKKIGSLASELDSSDARTGALLQENLQGRKEISMLAARMEEMEINSRNRDSELVEFKRQLVALKTNYSDASERSSRRNTKDQISVLKDEIVKLKADLYAYRNLSARSPSGYSGNTGKLSRGDRLPGRILGLGPHYSVLAISLGGDHGMQEAMKLQLVTAFGPIAIIEISKVEPQFSIAHILPGSHPRYPDQLVENEEISFIVQ